MGGMTQAREVKSLIVLRYQWSPWWGGASIRKRDNGRYTVLVYVRPGFKPDLPSHVGGVPIDWSYQEQARMFPSERAPLVFIDFDGVLNFSRLGLSMAKIMNRRVGPELFHPEKITLLNHLTNTAGAKLVISSMWRTWNTLAAIQAALTEAGATGEVIGMTPYLYDKRGSEVNAYLRAYEDTYGHAPRYVIFDDKDDDTLFLHGGSFIKTDSRYGLQAAHIAIALNALGVAA